MGEKIDVLFIDPLMKQYDDNSFFYKNWYQSNSRRNKVFNPDRSIINRFLFLGVLEYNIKVIYYVYKKEVCKIGRCS